MAAVTGLGWQWAGQSEIVCSLQRPRMVALPKWADTTDAIAMAWSIWNLARPLGAQLLL